MEEVRIRTILHQTNSLFSYIRFSKQPTEVVAKIADVSFSEKDKPESPMMRIIVNGQKYYCHKNASLLQDMELLKAVLQPNVHRI